MGGDSANKELDALLEWLVLLAAELDSELEPEPALLAVDPDFVPVITFVILVCVSIASKESSSDAIGCSGVGKLLRIVIFVAERILPHSEMWDIGITVTFDRQNCRRVRL